VQASVVIGESPRRFMEAPSVLFVGVCSEDVVEETLLLIGRARRPKRKILAGGQCDTVIRLTDPTRSRPVPKPNDGAPSD
jgi:hypothetical protein